MLFNRARNDALGTINRKKSNFFSEKLNENIDRPKELWKCLKNIGVTKSKSAASDANFCMKINNNFVFDHLQIANIFKDFFENLSTNLLNLLPRASNRFTKATTLDFYRKLNISKRFIFSKVDESIVREVIANLGVNK